MGRQMDKAKSDSSVAKALLESMKHGGLEQKRLEELVNVVAGLHQAGLQSLRLFPRGIFPDNVNGLEVQATVSAEKLPGVLTALTKEREVAGFIYFPYGIPYLTDARLEIMLGPSQANE
jgi:hypothetical protein